MPVNRNLPVGYADVAFILSLIGDPDPMVVTMGANPATTPTVAQANALKAAFGNRFAARIVNTYAIESVHILYQIDSALQIAVDSDTIQASMTNNSAAIPQNTAILVRKQTGFAGRAYRGRMYIPGVPEPDVSGTGELAGASLTAWQTAATGFLADFNDIMPAVLIHSCQYEENAPPCVPPVPTDVVSLQVDDFVATQRRRLRR